MTPKVLLVRITSELARYHEYYDSIDRLIRPPDTNLIPIHSSSPAANRNTAIKIALKLNKYTHIFFTDDDHVYSPDALLRLLARDVDIVSGLYCMKFPPFPLIALNNPNQANMSAFVDMSKHGPNELIDVPRVPAGCLLVTTFCLIKIQDYINNKFVEKDKRYKDIWFTLGHIQPDQWGDDLWFCDRAREAGYKIYLDTGVRVGHITKCTVTPLYKNGEWIIEQRINSEFPVEADPA